MRQQRGRIFLFVFVVSCTIYFACTRKSVKEVSDNSEEVTEVTVMQIQKEELFDYMSFSGTLAAQSQESVYAPLSGQIRQLAVQEGARVSKGDKLLVIKPDSEGNEYRDHVVKSPRNGVVLGGMSAKEGIHADRNQELMGIADLSSFKTEVSATVEDLNYLKKEQQVDVVLSPHDKEVKILGVVKSIPRTPDAKTKTFTVRVEIPCTSVEVCHQVYPGLLARVLVKKNPHFGFRLPFKYLRRQKSHILVLNKDSTVSFVEVVVGQHYGDDVEILKGITSETRIVTYYSSMPQEGEKVKVTAPKSTEENPKDEESKES
jgi:multidrug efflux pump subunit AcrA (membrane-fusion protein)